MLRKRVWMGIGRELAAGFEALKPLAQLDPARLPPFGQVMPDKVFRIAGTGQA
jgi:hypothetical protein